MASKPTKYQLDILQKMSKGVDVNKALTTGYDIDPETMTGGSALRTEFLAPRLTQLSYSADQMIFYNRVPKMPSSSVVAQYVTFNQHGETGHTAWNNEEDISDQKDVDITRGEVRMKYASTTRQVSLISQAVDNIQQPIQVLTDDAMVSLAKSIEQGSLYGDSDLTDGALGSGLEPNGLAKLIPESNVIDNRGEDISVKNFQDASVKIVKAYGTPTDAFMPTGVLANFNNDHGDVQRQLIGQSSNQINLGVNIPQVTTVGGTIRLDGSNVMENDNILNESRLGGQGAPGMPNVTAKVNTNGGGKFLADEVSAGTSYKVVVYADKSGSLATDAIPVSLANTTDSVTLTINVLASFQDTPKYVAIYRKGVTSGYYYQIARIGMNQKVANGKYNTITFTDTNDNMPETVDVFVGDMSPETIRLYELLPMFRLPLPSFNKMLTWACVWSGGLALIAPHRWVRIKNVGYTPVYPNNN